MEEEEYKEGFAERLLGWLGPSEAEASPVGKLIKAGAQAAKTALKKPLSSTSKKAVEYGATFMGKKVKAITKGRGNWRYIILEDDTVYPATKDVASDLIRHSGTGVQAVKLGLEKGEGRLEQALASLAYHESRSNPYLSKKLIKENYRDYTKQVKSQNLGAPMPYTLIQYGEKMFTIPSMYATILEKEGYIKVIEGLK